MKALVAAYRAVKGDAMAAAAEEVRTMQPGLPAVTRRCRKWWDRATAETALHSRLASWAGSVLEGGGEWRRGWG